MTQTRPRLGLVARADNGGLGVQTYDLYTHMHPDKVLVVDVSHLTGYTNHFERYPGAQIATGFEISEAAINEFLEGLDVVFTVECPYNHYLYQRARELGVKTVCQYNFEWLAHHQHPTLPAPDLFLAPSEWRREDMHWPTEYLHVPIDRQRFPFQERKIANTFLHIAGHPTFEDRNGTNTLLDALSLIQNHNIKIIIRTQGDIRPIGDHRLTVVNSDVKENKDMFEGDVLVLPRRYGGLSLQLNEAMSCGMVPLMTAVSPQNDLLDEHLLIPHQSSKDFMIKTNITSYEISPQVLATKIDEIAETDISRYSQLSDEYAKARDWEMMVPKYWKMLERVCSQ